MDWPRPVFARLTAQLHLPPLAHASAHYGAPPTPHRYSRLTEQFCYGDGPAYQLPVAQLIECSKCKQTHQAEARALHDEREEIRRLDSTEISEGGIWYIVHANRLTRLPPSRMQVLITAPSASPQVHRGRELAQALARVLLGWYST